MTGDDSFDIEEDEATPSESLPAPASTVMVNGYAIASDVIRVKVTDNKGKVWWRKIPEVLSTDAIALANDGSPLVMKRPVGRPAGKPGNLHEALPPSTPLVGDLIKIKAAQMRSDPLIQVSEDSPESPEVLDYVMAAIAEESASLRFERMEAERNGRDASAFSVRRVQALKALGDTWIKRKEQISATSLDMDSPAFEALFKFIVETFTRAMQAAGVRHELAGSVIGNFAKMLDDGWKNEARSRMKE